MLRVRLNETEPLNSDTTLPGDSAQEPRASKGAAPGPAHAGPERRQQTAFSGPDRRKFSWKTVVYGMFKRRRKGVRRAADAPNAYVDIHETNLLVVSSFILILCVLDGILTVHLAGIGALDLNRAMATLAHNDAVRYAIVKWLLTAFAVVALIISERAQLFGRIRGAVILYAIAILYFFMVAYSFALALIYS